MIPKNLSEVTLDWVADNLQEHAGASTLKNIELEPMGEGVGMMSAMSVIHLEWEGATELPASVVVKIAAENDTNRGVSQQFNLYLKEVSYYRDLAPLTSARSPKIYGSEIDAEQNFFLLMEDVSDYRMGSQVTGATLEECELCIDFLAQLHSSFRGKVEDVAWLPNMSNSDNARNMAAGCEVGWEQLLSFFGELVPASVNAKRDEYVAGIPAMQAYLDQAPRTLIHGDFRMDNMLFGQKPEHAPLTVVDFQGPVRGNGIHDIAYLLSHSAQTEVRRANEKALLRRYVNALHEAGITDYSEEQAWQDYRMGVLYAWTVAVVIAGTMDPANERGFAWMSKMVQRNGIALEDLDCLSLL